MSEQRPRGEGAAQAERHGAPIDWPQAAPLWAGPARLEDEKPTAQALAASEEERSMAFQAIGAQLTLACAEGDLAQAERWARQSLRWGRTPGHLEARQAVDACAKNKDPSASCLALLVEAGFKDPRAEALAHAATFGALPALEVLLPLGRARSQRSLALRCAAGAGRLEAARRLLPSSDPSAEDWEALAGAARGGHAPALDLLMSQNPPQVAIDRALAEAAGAFEAPCCAALAPHASDQGLALAARCAEGDLAALSQGCGARAVKLAPFRAHDSPEALATRAALKTQLESRAIAQASRPAPPAGKPRI